MRSWRPGSRAALAVLIVALAAAPAARAQDGVLGIFFDDGGQTCSGNVSTASFTTLYVVLLTEGSTRAGITGAEFRIDTSDASGYLFQNEQAAPDVDIYLPGALGGGTNLAFDACQNRTAIPLLSFQVLNSGSGSRDASLRIVARSVNPAFPCPLAVECDSPTYSEVCVDAAAAILNPTGARPCDASRVSSEWSRVKELYRR